MPQQGGATLRLNVDPAAAERGSRRARRAMDRLKTTSRDTGQAFALMGRQANNTFARMGTGAESAASRVQSLGNAASAALVGFAALGSRGFVAFDRALAETSTLIDGTTEEIRFLEQASKDLVAAYGGRATQQVEAFYQAISAGAGTVVQSNLLLETANRLAVGGVTEVATAVDLLTTVVNAYRDAGLEASRASDILFTGVRLGKTNIDELGSAIGHVVPTSAALGIGLDEVTAAVAALTATGQTTSKAVRGVNQALAAIVKPSSQATNLAEQLGIDFTAAGIAAQGFEGFLESLSRATDNSTAHIATLFGSVEAINAILPLVGGASALFARNLHEMATASGATDEAVRKVNDSLSKRLDKSLGIFNTRMIEFGEIAINVIVPAMESVNENFELFGVGLTAVGALVLAAGSPISGTIIGIAGAFTLVNERWDELRNALEGAGVFSFLQSGAESVSAGFIYLVSNVDLLVDAVSLLGAVIAGRFLASVLRGVGAIGSFAFSMTTATGAATGLSAALGLVGGPLGLVTTAVSLGATAWLLWRDNAEEAVNDAIEQIGRLEAAADPSIALNNLAQPILDQLSEIRAEIDRLEGSRLQGAAGFYNTTGITIEVTRLREEADRLTDALSRLESLGWDPANAAAQAFEGTLFGLAEAHGAALLAAQRENEANIARDAHQRRLNALYSDANDAYQEVINSIDSTANATRVLNSRLDAINRAYEIGVISVTEHAHATSLAIREYEDSTSALNSLYRAALQVGDGLSSAQVRATEIVNELRLVEPTAASVEAALRDMHSRGLIGNSELQSSLAELGKSFDETESFVRDIVSSIQEASAGNVDYAAALSSLNAQLSAGTLSTGDYNSALDQVRDSFNSTAVASGAFSSSLVSLANSGLRSFESESVDAAAVTEYFDALLRQNLISQDQYAGGLEASLQALENLRSGTSDASSENERLRTSYENVLSRLDPLAARQIEYERSIQILSRALDAGVITQTEYARGLNLLENEFLGLTEAEERAARELEILTESVVRLTSSLDPLLAKQRQYDNDLQVLNQALAEGIISQLQYDDSLARLTDRLQGTSEAAEEAAKAKERLAASVVRLTSSLDPVLEKQRQYESDSQLLRQALDAGIITHVEYGQILRQLTDRLNGVAEAAAEAARTQERISKSFRDLTSSLDPALSRMRDYHSQHRILSEALEAGIIDHMQYAYWLDIVTDNFFEAAHGADSLTQELHRVRSALDPAYEAATVLAQRLSVLEQAFNRGDLNAEEYQALVEAARQAAEGITSVSSAVDDAAKEFARLVDAVNALRGSLDSTYARALEFRNNQELLNQALEAGVISGEEYAIILEDLQDEYTGAADAQRRLHEGAVDFFADVLAGAKSATQAVRDFGRQLLNSGIREGLSAIFNPGATQLARAGGLAGGGLLATAGAASAGGSGVFGGLFSQGLSGIFGLGGTFAQAGASLASNVASFLGAGQALTSAITSLGSVIGAAIPVIGVAYGLYRFFVGSRRTIDSGIEASFQGNDFDARNFQRIRRTRFFGLSTREYDRFSDIDPQAEEAIRNAFDQIQGSVQAMSEVLGVGAQAFDDFTHEFRLSLQGLSEEQAATAIREELQKLADAYASVTVPDEFIRDGEGAGQALERLSSSLGAFNLAMRGLGLTLANVSVAGADAASSFIDLFGSLDSFVAATDFYFQNFFSLAERTERSANQLGVALSEIGVDAVPETREQFRALVEFFDSIGDRRAVATLIGLSGAFDEIVRNTEELLDAELRAAREREEAQRRLAEAQARENARLAEAQARENARLNDVYNSLFSESQLAAMAAQQLSEILNGLGVDAIPRTRDQYRQLIDTFNAAGDRDAVVELLNAVELLDVVLSSVAAVARENARLNDVYNSLFSESQLAAMAAQQLSEILNGLGVDAIPRTRDQYRQLIDTFNAAGDRDAVVELLNAVGLFDTVLSSVATVVREASAEVRDVLNAEKDLASDLVRSAEAAVGEAQARFDALDRGLADRFRGTQSELDTARATLRSREASASDLSSAVQVLNRLGTEGFSSRAEFEFARSQDANLIRGARGRARTALSLAEETLGVAEAQLNAVEMQLESLAQIDDTLLAGFEGMIEGSDLLAIAFAESVNNQTDTFMSILEAMNARIDQAEAAAARAAEQNQVALARLASIAKNTKRSADLALKDDVIGQPHMREDQ